jgi:hypothetical protein
LELRFDFATSPGEELLNEELTGRIAIEAAAAAAVPKNLRLDNCLEVFGCVFISLYLSDLITLKIIQFLLF